MSRFTLWGAYQYDETLFDDVRWTETELEKDVTIRAIMSTSGELYPIHQTVPMLKNNIGLWFNRNLKQFNFMVEAVEAEFSPIENYDRYEDITRTPNLLNERESTAESSSESSIGTSAYNENEYSNRDKTTASSDGSSNETIRQTGNEKTIAHTHGNIGVMSSTELVERQIRLREEFGDVYKRIAKMFEREFLSQVY